MNLDCGAAGVDGVDGSIGLLAVGVYAGVEKEGTVFVLM